LKYSEILLLYSHNFIENFFKLIKDLANVTIRDVPSKNFSTMYNEIYPEIDNFRKETNEQHKKNNNLFKIFPTL